MNERRSTSTYFLSFLFLRLQREQCPCRSVRTILLNKICLFDCEARDEELRCNELNATRKMRLIYQVKERWPQVVYMQRGLSSPSYQGEMVTSWAEGNQSSWIPRFQKAWRVYRNEDGIDNAVAAGPLRSREGPDQKIMGLEEWES